MRKKRYAANIYIYSHAVRSTSAMINQTTSTNSQKISREKSMTEKSLGNLRKNSTSQIPKSQGQL